MERIYMIKLSFKMPKFITVFGLKIKIKINENIGQNAAGLYEPMKATIHIHPDHPNEVELLHTMLHESGHAMFYRVSIHQAVSKEVHEFIVDNFATMLLENFDIKPKAK